MTISIKYLSRIVLQENNNNIQSKRPPEINDESKTEKSFTFNNEVVKLKSVNSEVHDNSPIKEEIGRASCRERVSSPV